MTQNSNKHEPASTTTLELITQNLLVLTEFIFRKYKNKLPFVGYFNFLTPYLLVIDTELAKQIMVKDFKHFRNNEFSSLVSNSSRD